MSAFRRLGKARALAVLLLLGLLSAQLVSIQHDHEGELDHHADCTVCLKLKSGPDLLAHDGPELESEKQSVAIGSYIPALAYSSVPAAKSRSPPQ